MLSYPIRTCLGCRAKRSKNLMRRLAVDTNGLLVLDSKQCLPGRGGYVCFNDRCVAQALKRKDLSRIFKKPVRGFNLGNLGAQGEVTKACQR